MLRRTGDALPGHGLPLALRRELARRRADLQGHDRDGPAVSGGAPDGPVALGWDDLCSAERADLGPAPRRLVSVAELARCPNVNAALNCLVAARNTLGPGGRVDLFEPYRRTGAVWSLVAALSPVWRRLFGVRLDLPLPALVRQAGFTLASVERLSMPMLFPPLRPFCSIVALVPEGPTEPSVAADRDAAGTQP